MRFILAIICLAFLAGTFDACMDARRDYAGEAIFARIEAQWFQDWYAGGNNRYSLPVWGPWDFWHFSKSCLMGCWSLIAVLSFFAGAWRFVVEKWYHGMILFLAVYWTEALTFTLFYHVIWRL
jgi:hypothetical protein